MTIKIKDLFFYLAASVIILAALKEGSQVASFVFLSLFFTAILSPVHGFLRNRGVPNLMALLVVLVIVTLIFFFVSAIIQTSIVSFIDNWPLYKQKFGVLLLDWLKKAKEFGVQIDPEDVFTLVDFNAIFSFSKQMVGNIGSIFSAMLLLLLGTGFLLVEGAHFEKKLKTVFKRYSDAMDHFTLFWRTLQRYFTIKTLTSLLTGTVVTVALLIFDIEYPLLWGLLAFLLNFIPVVGSFVAAIPALFLALILEGLSTFLWLTLIYFIVNNFITNVIEPKLMGSGLGLSPAVVFFSLIFWGWVLGPAGMFLAVPLTMTLKIAFESNEQTAWIGFLLAGYKNKNSNIKLK